MSYVDEIAQKRKDQLAQKAADGLHNKSIEAIFGSGNKVAQAVATGNQDLAKKDDIDKVISELKELQLTNLLAANKPDPKPAMNITDSAAYVGDSIKELSDKLMEKLNDSSMDVATHKQLAELQFAIQTLDKSRQGDGTSMASAVKKVQSTLDALDINPVVNIPAPKVTVQAPKIDLGPLQDTLKEYLAPAYDDGPEKLDLTCYKAQDLKNSGDIQYVGFVNPEGNWYILENNVRENSLRYVFGNQGYQKAFDNAGQYEYSLLNEAINALTA